MDELELKKVISSNIIKLRKENNMTQMDLAKELNYSDKAISKWERSEVIPDIFTLNKIAALFNTTVSAICGEVIDIPIKVTKEHPFYKKLFPYFGALIVIIVFTLVFVIFEIINFQVFPFWLFLIYQIPFACIPILVFSCIRHKYLQTLLVIYLMILTIVLSLFLTMNYTNLLVVKEKSYIIWLITIPLSIINLLWYLYQINKPNTKYVKGAKK